MGGMVLIVLVAAYLAGPSLGFGRGWERENWPTRFQSNGERIYFTATSASGLPVSASGGGMHMQMHSGSCATCHGGDRQGRRLMPRFWLVAPPLTPAALFNEHGDKSEDDGHGDHEGYDDASLRRAITQGLDPSAQPLDREMPRWTLADQDLADLIEFLKSPARNSRSPSH